MRTVAVLLALVSALALLPPASANDCTTNAAQARVCQEFEVERPSMPPNVPAVPDTPYWDTYYVFIGGSTCTSNPLGNPCRGIPAAPGSGVPLPSGGNVPAVGVFGILWQETNNVPGLQRATSSGASVADKMVLI